MGEISQFSHKRWVFLFGNFVVETRIGHTDECFTTLASNACYTSVFIHRINHGATRDNKSSIHVKILTREYGRKRKGAI